MRQLSYNGSMTREQFLFHETRVTARLMIQGLSNDEIICKIIGENLFQNPTERMLKNLARVCIRRLEGLEDMALIQAVANAPVEDAKQICLYAMMLQYRIMWDFMISVIGEKYQQQDMNFSRADVNVFFLRLQEQDETVASWSASTIAKLESVVMKILIDTEYVEGARATRLNPVLLSPLLENSIRASNNELALSAFNCFN